MGCCLTTAATGAAAGDDHHQHVDSKPISKLRDGPPPPPEEETVKEVLSETPIISKQPPPSNSNSNSTPTKITSDNQQILRSEKHDVVRFTKNRIEENASEVSSEMYTYSESFSAATTTTTSLAADLKRGETGIDEDGEVTQKVKKRPPAKMVPRKPPTTSSVERARRKERGIRPSPPSARRSAIPSTDKKIQLPSRNITTAERHRNVVPSNVFRRELPARRSRSPAMRREEGQLRKVKERSPVGKSGNRVSVNVTENEGSFKSKKTTDGGVVPSPEPEPETETCESLENPLVSLECFIFL